LGRAISPGVDVVNEESRRWWTFTRSRAKGWMMKAEKIRQHIGLRRTGGALLPRNAKRVTRRPLPRTGPAKVSTG